MAWMAVVAAALAAATATGCGSAEEETPKGEDAPKTGTKDPAVETPVTPPGPMGEGELKEGWMIPISFQSDIGRIHQKAGFTVGGE